MNFAVLEIAEGMEARRIMSGRRCIHPVEYQGMVVRVQIDGAWHAVGAGDVVFVPPNTQHTYVNAGDAPFKFLCGIPVSGLMPK